MGLTRLGVKLVLALFMAHISSSVGSSEAVAYTTFQASAYSEPPPYSSPSDSSPIVSPPPKYNYPTGKSMPPSSDYSPAPTVPDAPGYGNTPGGYSTPSPTESVPVMPNVGSPVNVPENGQYAPVYSDPPSPPTPTDPSKCPPLLDGIGEHDGDWWEKSPDASTTSYGGGPDAGSTPAVPQDPYGVPYTPPVGGDPYASPYTPDPSVPDSPVPNTPGTCSFWTSNTHKFPDFLTILTPILDIFGGNSGSIFGSQMTLFQGLTNSRPDAFGSLLRQGSAAVLNSYTSRDFAFTPFQVKNSFRGALVSQQAAAMQAVIFENANRGFLRRQ
ncbi:uncharacterized protein [Physcomitrium patens]|uniref:Uncharacterized protein n=1 Tax=Physcomitrium patens TaxID=3218 RepID=A0A2K1KNU8_PHYPA|nr:extensin-like [Physcomitrium patens]PNR55436.1 hypothetical protein PHYPA_006333 [Physcomitrium patens]|eukprot:XP_024373034.1 extensin-like [Physcomitrella patens]